MGGRKLILGGKSGEFSLSQLANAPKKVRKWVIGSDAR
jgi:hypothetical protein